MTWWGVGAAVAGTLISSQSSQNAASTQAQGATDAASIAANAQLQGLQLVQQQEAPYSQAGQQALSQYQNLLNGGATNFNIAKLPGYQFEMQQGQNALANSAAARGQALSGNTIQATQQFGQGLASTQFQQYMQQLAGLANLGQAAASNTANQGASLLSGAGASLAGGAMGAANANAAGIVGSNNALVGGINTVFNNPSVQSGLSSLFSNSGSSVPIGGDVGYNSQAIINSGAMP